MQVGRTPSPVEAVSRTQEAEAMRQEGVMERAPLRAKCHHMVTAISRLHAMGHTH